MTTPHIPRRSFLRTLGLATVAPLIAARALFASRTSDRTSKAIDLMRAADRDFAVSSKDLAAALARAGDTARDAERSFDDLNGAAIKVPSNRCPLFLHGDAARPRVGYLYFGDWDGTFKDEAGCSNAAFIFADLAQREWDRYHAGELGTIHQHPEPFDWTTIYHWGQACDEMVLDTEVEHFNPRWDGGTPDSNWGPRVPRHQINTFVRTRAEQDDLRGHLRMCFIAWKAQDERYRTSWPVYPEEMT